MRCEDFWGVVFAGRCLLFVVCFSLLLFAGCRSLRVVRRSLLAVAACCLVYVVV